MNGHPTATFDKQAVAGAFGRAAQSYGSVADVQRTAAGWLLQSVQRQQDMSDILDVGCGDGAVTKMLGDRMTFAEIEAIDIAPDMLEVARAHNSLPWVRYLEGDAEDIPFEEKSFSLVFSNFVLQWCNDPVQALAEMRRVLRRNGQLVLSLPGAGTLAELAQAWRAVDGDVHVHPFPDEDTLADWVAAAGFAHADISTRRLRLHVPDTLALMRELKAMGAHNQHPGRPRMLTGRGRLQRMQEAYEARREAAGLPVTWQVMMLAARR